MGTRSRVRADLEPSGRAPPMFVNRMPRYEILSEDAMDTLDTAGDDS